MMSLFRRLGLTGIFSLTFRCSVIFAQQDSAWTLDKCIAYALEQNLQIRQSELSIQSQIVNLNQAKAQRFPSVNASVNQNFAWSKQGSGSEFSSSGNTSYGISTGVVLFSGFSITTGIRQASINKQASEFDYDALKESVSLNVMDAYLQVLYAEEQVKNSKNQVAASEEQLRLAEERLKVRSIATSDYLQVKSQLATERQNLASAESQLALARVSLMQLMEMPVNDTFKIAHPVIDSLIGMRYSLNSDSIYRNALTFKPQIQAVRLRTESSLLDEKIARAGLFPKLSLNAGVNTGYSSLESGLNYTEQLNNKIAPSLGISLSIPIYQKREVKSRIESAKIQAENAHLEELNTMNQLRKNIEQACTDIRSAEREYEAGVDGYQSALESYKVAEEKYRQGLINSVDFLIQKTNLNTAESRLLQAKFNLIFAYKVLDFYTGNPLTL